MNQRETVLAVDLGGTKLLIGEVDDEGNIRNSKKYNSGYLNQRQAVELIEHSIQDYIDTVGFTGSQPKKMGVGMIGQVDYKNGIWIMIDPSRQESIPIADRLSQRFSMDCSADNDVKAAVIAELNYGAGKGMDHLVYLNIGTGIAAGIISNGRIIRGWQNDSGEIGHMTVDYNSSTGCICGRYGCAEAIASGIGMDKRVRQYLCRYPESSLSIESKKDFIRAEMIFSEAEKGDVLASKIAADAADAASELIMNIVRMCNPQRIVLGGGVAGSSFMQRELPKRLRIPCMKSVIGGVVLSELNPDTAGLIGAAAVGFQLTGNE